MGPPMPCDSVECEPKATKHLKQLMILYKFVCSTSVLQPSSSTEAKQTAPSLSQLRANVVPLPAHLFGQKGFSMRTVINARLLIMFTF